MIYIISEDSGYGLEFWNYINRLFLNEMAHIQTSRGNRGITAEIARTPARAGDLVIVAFDRVNDRIIRTIRDFVDLGHIVHKYDYVLTDYYCIEEVFLSFSLLTKWLNVSSDKLESEMIYLIQEYINGGSKLEYWANDNPVGAWCNCICKVTNEKNREQMDKALLQYITRYHGHGFEIHGSDIGPCWFDDCVLNETSRCQGNNCSIYKENKQELTGADKLETVWDNSIAGRNMGTLSEFILNITKNI